MSENDLILVGDIGGTNVRFALASRSGAGEIQLIHFFKRPGDDFAGISAAIAAYLAKTQARPRHVSLAVAGPVNDGEAVLTNRAWSVSEKQLSKTFDLDGARLFNDFAAMTRSVPEMCPSDFHAVKPGEAHGKAPLLVAGPGTGFGAGYLVPNGSRWYVLPSEGGHMAYAPRTRFEVDVALILAKSHDFVSLELISSGSGLDAVHEAVCQVLGKPYIRLSPAQVKSRADAGDLVCERVCSLRSAAVMGAIGDLVLAGGARAGVALAGGVSERMIDWFEKPEAMARFLERGSHSAYVKDVPINLLTSPEAPLAGAAALYWDA